MNGFWNSVWRRRKWFISWMIKDRFWTVDSFTRAEILSMIGLNPAIVVSLVGFVCWFVIGDWKWGSRECFDVKFSGVLVWGLAVGKIQVVSFEQQIDRGVISFSCCHGVVSWSSQAPHFKWEQEVFMKTRLRKVKRKLSP